jgi:hypothetical protein
MPGRTWFPREGHVLSNSAHKPTRCTRMPPNAPKRTAMRAFAHDVRESVRVCQLAKLEMHPNAPQCPQMPPQTRIRQNEPTASPVVDTGLPQLTPVDAGLPQHAIFQNEPTAAHPGTFRRIPTAATSRVVASPGVQPDATPCNAMQPGATVLRVWKNEPTAPATTQVVRCAPRRARRARRVRRAARRRRRCTIRSGRLWRCRRRSRVGRRRARRLPGRPGRR